MVLGWKLYKGGGKQGSDSKEGRGAAFSPLGTRRVIKELLGGDRTSRVDLGEPRWQGVSTRGFYPDLGIE